MIITLNKDQFIEKIIKVRPDNFSIEGLHILFEYYEALEEDCETKIEFDPIAICCEWSEYSNISEALEDCCIEDWEELHNMTTVLSDEYLGNMVLIREF